MSGPPALPARPFHRPGAVHAGLHAGAETATALLPTRPAPVAHTLQPPSLRRPMVASTAFRFDNSYARELQGFHVPWQPAAVPAPTWLFLNRPLAAELGLDAAALEGDDGAAVFAGNTLPEGAEPIAQAYAGHQFGGFSPQLGDGRAVLLGEVIDRAGRRRDIAFKGSGRTPFSRGGDGRAAVGPMLREALIAEAMHALGIPTTRALAVVATGEAVRRERALPGAVLTRVAASHIRVGTFQFFAARGDHERVRQLADYTIARHDPDLAGSPRRYLGLLEHVAARQAALIAQWMNVGFIHGVMNTDNMTLSGETIDYGPCAFLEAYDPEAVFSSIDHQGRYAYGNQAHIARWNLARLAETLLPLLDSDADAATAQAMQVIDAFPALHRACLLRGQRAKLGLQRTEAADDDRRCLAGRRLAGAAACRPDRLHAGLAAAGRRRGRRRGAAARAVRRPSRARRLAGALARALRARRRRHADGRCRYRCESRRRRRHGCRRRTRCAHAPRQPVADPAQPPRRGSARRRLRRRRPRSVRTPARRIAPAV